jgi:hypothetical protein
MSDALDQQISLFRSLIKTRRFHSNPFTSISISFPFPIFSIQFLGLEPKLSITLLLRFDDATLRILESVLVSKSVKSLKEVESSLRALLRSEALSTIREIAEKPVGQKLVVIEFFVRAFALIADVEALNLNFNYLRCLVICKDNIIYLHEKSCLAVITLANLVYRAG